MADDREIWLTPKMTGVAAVVADGEGALSTFPTGFSGIMIGAQAVPGVEPMVVIGVLAGDGRFLAGATSRAHYLRLYELLGQTIEAIDRGDFALAEVSQ